MKIIVLVDEAYAGGATAFTASFPSYSDKYQLSLVGFSSADATIEVLALNQPDYEVVTSSTDRSNLLIEGVIKGIRISGLPAGSYRIVLSSRESC